MRHGAQRYQAQLHGKQHVAGAGQLPGHAGTKARSQRAQHLLMPGLAKTPARAVIGDLEFAQPSGLQFSDFGIQALAAFGQIGLLLRIAKVDLVDDGQHRNFKQDGVQPRALDRHLDLARSGGRDRHIFFIEPEDAQKIDEVALDEAHGFQVGQLGILKAQAAQSADFFANFVHIGRQLANAGSTRVAALEFVLHLGTRKVVQHHLHHGELVQVGIEQAGDDHGEPERTLAP